MSCPKLFFVGYYFWCFVPGFFSTAFGEMMMNSAVGVASGDVFRYSYTCYFDSKRYDA